MKTAFVFSGQGAQYHSMGKELYDHYSVCREIFNRADNALGLSITDICFNENNLLNETEYTQPATLTMSMACYYLVTAYGINADCFAGFSLGEYSAYTASGVFNFEDAVSLVRKRGRFMTEAAAKGQGTMSAVMGLDSSILEKLCEKALNKGLVICANYNMPGQTVIAGEISAVEEAERLAKETGAKRTVRLNVSGPFHTKLLEPASKLLEEALDTIDLKPLAKPVYTNLTGQMVKPGDNIKNILIQQVMNPVLWDKSIREMIAQGVSTFVELGPGKTLSGFIKKIDKNAIVYHVEDVKSFEKTMNGLKG